MHILKQFILDDEGTSTLEFGIIGALLALGLLASAVIMVGGMGHSATTMASAISAGG